MISTPTILIDTREQRPLEFGAAYPTERVGLPVGDYGIRGFSDWDNPAFIVERKSLEDLAGSLGRGRSRFFRECEKLRAFRFAALVIEAHRSEAEMGAYHSALSPAALLATLDVLSVRCGLHVYWAESPDGAARQVEGLVRQFVRGVEKDAKRLGGETT